MLLGGRNNRLHFPDVESYQRNLLKQNIQPCKIQSQHNPRFDESALDYISGEIDSLPHKSISHKVHWPWYSLHEYQYETPPALINISINVRASVCHHSLAVLCCVVYYTRVSVSPTYERDAIAFCQQFGHKYLNTGYFIIGKSINKNKHST